MAKEKRKTPSDYPMFFFRVSAEDKARLDREIDVVRALYERKRGADEYAYTKGRITVMALEKGLAALKRGKG